LGGLAYVVAGAFGSMALTADQMDDARAVDAANGALASLKKQLSATTRDNAYWDDAYQNVNSVGGAAWSVENWGIFTADYPLYDTALVVEGNGNLLMAYHKGGALTDAGLSDLFGRSLADMVTAARRAGFGAEGLPVAFVRSREGIAAVGAAAIQPSIEDETFDIEEAKILVFSKQLTSDVVAEMGNSFSIQGLSLTDTSDESSMLHADVNDINGTEIARLTWPPIHPGTASYERIRPTVMGAISILVLLLGAVAVAGLVIYRGLRNDERAANHKAKHDELTGLWNRAGCLEELEARLNSGTGRLTALNILDLDGFKPVNDAWGHLVGDELIKAVATRLLASLPPTAVVARLGGDEFAMVHELPVLDANAKPIADRILTALGAPFLINGRTIEIGGSVGWAEACAGEVSSFELLRRADLALYRAKDLGRGRAVFYDSSLDEDADRCMDMEQELRQAIMNGDVRVVFQPLINAKSREVSGVEALARWTSPTRGPVSPEVFIRVAEKAGLIEQLGYHILRTAIREGARWPGIDISVNISPLQLRNPYFCSQVRDALAEARFAPERLTVEVTEGVLILNPAQVKRAFKGLRELGVKIALDDFGCGYASIGALREFGFDSMKIDRSLIVALDRDLNGGAVLQATVALANALQLPVTAEGIETEEQATVVRLSGCGTLQGYLFSMPLAGDEITAKYFPESRASRLLSA
tara:strand:+ start:1072 stop:3180 length:2109 start_codon:yes stop_codon:yes gene_type:complete